MTYRRLPLSPRPLPLRALPLFSIAFIALPSYADSSAALDTVVVTATRTAVPSQNLLSSVSVITRDDIEKYNYQTLAQAISALPGVTIANTGGIGKQTSLFLRGTESNHTQIILNGVKLATNEFGAPQLEHIPLNQIERIELVRGPQSALYGSESIGGTIQIFTKKGADTLTPRFSVAYGTHNTKQTNASLSGGSDNSWFNIGLGFNQTDGFNACDGRSATLSIGCFANEPDKDGYLNRNSSIRAGYRFDNSAEIDVFSLYSEGSVHFDGFFNKTEFVQHTYGANVDFNVTDNWSIKTTLSQSRMEAENTGATAASFADNKQNNFSIQNDFNIADKHTFTVGYDFEDDKIQESSDFSQTERDNHAIFAQLLGETGAHDYRLAIRNDDNEQFGGNTTGNAAWGISLNTNLRGYVSYGTAFVAPALIDLYNPDFFGFPTSNPDLKPEKSKSFEIGFTGQYSTISWSTHIYNTKIKDLIALDTFFVPQNISDAEIRGVEFEVSTRLSGIDLNSQISLMNAEDKSGGVNDGNVLPRRAEQTFTFNASKSFGKFSLASKLFVSGKRYDDAANTRRLGGFTTVDVIGAYQLTSDTSLRLKISNLFDKQYETVSGFNTDGTNLLLSINYQP
ncbi:MAG: TonB-dependent receptor [Gammaproteobacteria bacterium]|nr:TonB-dependent receptor [Gammaproteobacteria bacterium]